MDIFLNSKTEFYQYEKFLIYGIFQKFTKHILSLVYKTFYEIKNEDHQTILGVTLVYSGVASPAI